MAQWLSCFRPEAITFLEREAHGPSEAGGRGEQGEDWSETPCLPGAFLLSFLFSDQVKRQSPTHSPPVWACSTLALGVRVGTSQRGRGPCPQCLEN